MSLLRDAIRHSATGAVKRSGDSKYIEPRVQVYCHPFKQAPGAARASRRAKIPASTRSGKRGFQSHHSRQMARPSRPGWIGCSHHGKLHRRTDNGVPPRRNREEYAATLSPWHLKKTGSSSASLSPLVSAPSPAREMRRLQCPGSRPRKSWERKPCSAKGRHAFRPRNGPPVSAVLAWNESRTNRARIANSPLGGFVHGHISWRRKYIPQHRVSSGPTIIAVAANRPTVEFAAGSSTGSHAIAGRLARPTQHLSGSLAGFIASWRWSCSDAGARRTGSPA